MSLQSVVCVCGPTLTPLHELLPTRPSGEVLRGLHRRFALSISDGTEARFASLGFGELSVTAVPVDLLASLSVIIRSRFQNTAKEMSLGSKTLYWCAPTVTVCCTGPNRYFVQKN